MKGNIQGDSVFFFTRKQLCKICHQRAVLMSTSYGKNSLKEAWSMEHWLWQLTRRQGPVGMHDYKESDYSHRSVAFAHSDLDAPATCPRTGTKGAPHSPCPLHRCGVMLFGYTQAVFAVLQWGRNRSQMNEESKNRSRGREWGKRVKKKNKSKTAKDREKVKNGEEQTEWAHEILSMELATHLSVLSCFDANLGEIIQWSKWKKEEPKKGLAGHKTKKHHAHSQ